jgi:GNAT superfamily N-acetyltransferase
LNSTTPLPEPGAITSCGGVFHTLNEDENMSKDNVELHIRDCNLFVLQTTFHGEYICSANSILQNDRWWIVMVFTHPEFRNKGYATKLLKIMKKDLCASPQGNGSVYINVKSFDDNGMSDYELYEWYKSMGFRDCNDELHGRNTGVFMKYSKVHQEHDVIDHILDDLDLDYEDSEEDEDNNSWNEGYSSFFDGDL